MCPPFSTSVQLRDPLPLSVLRQESCPHISAHDVVSLCQLEYHALGYGGGARENGSSHLLTSATNPLLKRVEAEKKGRAGKGGRKGKRGVLVDIRPQEEYLPHLYYVPNMYTFTKIFAPSLTLSVRFRLGHVPGSLNLPKQHAFQPDGSLTPSSSSALSSVRSSSVVIVVANKGETGPVVRSVHIQSDLYRVYVNMK